MLIKLLLKCRVGFGQSGKETYFRMNEELHAKSLWHKEKQYVSWLMWLECWNQEGRWGRGNKRGKPRGKIKNRRFTCYTMEIKEKECFKNKEISHVKCFDKIKQELFWFWKGSCSYSREWILIPASSGSLVSQEG